MIAFARDYAKPVMKYSNVRTQARLPMFEFLDFINNSPANTFTFEKGLTEVISSRIGPKHWLLSSFRITISF